MIRYATKRPVTIRCCEWTGDNHDEILKLAGLNSDTSTSVVDGELFIETLEGTMRANKGDIVIRGIAGELYACEPNIFLETYEYN